MANATVSLCPAPFLPEAKYPGNGGFVQGRACSPIGDTQCCLPCPQTNWVYPDNFAGLSQAANWINVGGMILCAFLLLSFGLLPVERTHRHYLSVCLVLAIVLMQLGFIIPLAVKPEQCYDEITPNDMHSSGNCAASGAFLLAGGWCGVMWVFMRSLTLHLQICWQVITGKKFFLGALLAGWGIPAIFLAIALSVTGVSYRFGNTCHINHAHALPAFWGPLLAFGGATALIQFATFGYCIKVYIKSLIEGPSSGTQSSGLPSYNGSVRTMTARQTYKRVRRVVELQWRGIMIVIVILVDVVFFSVVFLYLDSKAQQTPENLAKEEPWLLCLIIHNGDKNQCLDLASAFSVNEATVMAVLILLSMNGFWCLIFLGQWSMLGGWVEWVQRRFQRRREFVSVDARRLSTDPRTYEMLQSPPQADLKSPEPAQTPPPPQALTPSMDDDYKGSSSRSNSRSATGMGSHSDKESERGGRQDYFGAEATYNSPHLSFSSPRAPTWATTSRDWDATDGRTLSRDFGSERRGRNESRGSRGTESRDPSINLAKSVISRPTR